MVKIPENKIVVDDLPGAEEEAGELIAAAAKGQWSFSNIHGSLEELVVGKVTGRQRADEITISKSVGASYYDLAVAIGVYKKALQENSGMRIEID